MAVKTTGLGKGLGALLGDYEEQPGAASEIDIKLIDRNAAQPRKQFDEEQLKELSESIKQHGIVQPLLLVKNGSRYTIVAGERRFRAAKLAGLKTVPAVVRDFEEEQLMEVSLIENIQRTDLNPVEEARAIKYLMDQHGLTQDEVAEKLGKSRPAIANALRLLNLPATALELLINGKLSAGHARALLAVQGEAKQNALALRAASEGLSVRQVEALAKQPEPKPVKKLVLNRHDDLFDIEERIREAIGTKVKLTGTPKSGKLLIEYFSQDELERIYNALING
jgi:ParB family chromosome partitioning protein